MLELRNKFFQLINFLLNNFKFIIKVNIPCEKPAINTETIIVNLTKLVRSTLCITKINVEIVRKPLY